MKNFRSSAQLPSQLFSSASGRTISAPRFFRTASLNSAVAHPITAHGPPPKAPSPAPGFEEHAAQRGINESNKRGSTAGWQLSKRTAALNKRFWKDVNVAKKSDGEYHVLLDTRPVRTPMKDVLSIPATKPHLAHAIALEWDVMKSAREALKSHLIPLTSLAARAADIAREDANGDTSTRNQILKTTLGYLDTDTLLCWVPEQDVYKTDTENAPTETLRTIQMRVAKDITSYLTTKVWPGIEITPMPDENSILPTSQPQATKDIIRKWVSDLLPHDLAAFERGVLASKSLLVATRLLVEWSENFRPLQQPGQKRFGIEEAAEASSLEVRWQTEMWGEVEDTHDVNKEDLRRQLGSVIVLVSGETR